MSALTGDWHRRLAVRLAFVLSIALIPIGLLAVMQTDSLVSESRRRADAALVGLTRDAAIAEREIIQRAFGMARGLAPIAAMTRTDPDACSAALGRFVSQQELAVTIGVIAPDGQMWCSSSGQQFDFSGWPDWAAAVAAPRASVTVNPAAPISGRPVVVSMQPYEVDGRLGGFVFVSIPHEALAIQPATLPGEGVTVLTFTPRGDVLATGGATPSAEIDALLPRSRSLDMLAQSGAQTFRDRSQAGAMRSYAVSPVVDGTVYALGTWPVEGAAARFPPQLFPIIMWLTSLGVALAAVHRLVIRHIARLRRQMRAFARQRQMPTMAATKDSSAEIAEIHTSFRAMANEVLRDEAALEQLVEEKNVLLREVHHRVKNNLQLISSIMNLQVRQLRSKEARSVVARLQERVLGLATIHRTLYRTENLSRVQIAAMLTELTDQLLSLGQSRRDPLRLERSFADLALSPDQAVPLALFVAEAVTNALKHVGLNGSSRWLRITLGETAEGNVRLEIANSRTHHAEPGAAAEGSDGSGLGSELMRGFVQQLGGTLEIDDTDHAYRVVARFTPRPAALAA